MLVAVCGANDSKDNKSMFLFAQTSDDPPYEYRFQGDFGFGGKFWNTHDRWYVNCYREDETPSILRKIEIANQALLRLRDKRDEERRSNS